MMLKLAVAAVCALSGRAAGALHDQIYTTLSLNGVSRLLDNTGQIGASTAADGSVGALYQIAADGDADSFVQNANGEAYVALITTDQLANNITVSKLLGQDKLKGLLAYEAAVRPADGSVRPADWSADSNPNGINPNGGGYGATGTTGMHWIDIGVPLFLLTKDDAVTVLARFADSKTPDEPSRETLGVRLKFFQWAATDAATCLRRSHQGSKFCQPLGGYTVGASLAPIVHKPTIVVAAQMDGLALFHDHSWGGAASAASLAGMVALAGMVSNPTVHDVNARENAAQNVVFLAFQGEQFNNIGSSAFMDSVGQGQFPGGTEAPLELGDITNWLELSSMALIGAGATTTYAHGASGSSLMAKLAANEGITDKPSSELPPSSIKALRDWQPAWAAVDAVVVGDYSETYSYNISNDTQTTGMNYRYTHNDNMRNLFGKVVSANSTDNLSDHMEHLCTSVCAMARTVEEVAYGTASTVCTAGGTAMDECQRLTWQLLKAMLVDGSMRVNVTETVVVEGATKAADPINRYTSVYYDQISKDPIEAFMFWHMSAALSSVTTTSNATDYSCEQPTPEARNWHLVQTSNPEGTANSCFNTTAFFMDAVSPGLNDNLDGITNASYSTWVESTWNDGAVDLFLINDDSESNALLGVGLTYFVLVSAAVKYLSSAISQVAAASN